MKYDISQQLNDDNIFLQRIKQGDEKVIGNIYKKYHNDFKVFVKNRYPKLGAEKVEDVYDESFHILTFNVLTGKLITLNDNCTLKTYLFKVAKFKIIDLIKERRLPPSIPTPDDDDKKIEEYISFSSKSPESIDDGDDDMDEFIDTKTKLGILRDTVEKLTQPCEKLLKLYWYEEKSDKEILEMTDYSSTDTVKNQRARCMKKLKEVYLNKLESERLITISEKNRLIGG